MTTLPTHPLFTELAAYERDTLPKIFLHGLSFGNAIALSSKRNGLWESLSHQEVEDRVRAVAAWLETVGIEPRDRVALLSENRTEWAIVDFAVLGLGAIPVPAYPSLPAAQVAYGINDSGARVLFVSNADQAAKTPEIRQCCPHLEWIISFDELPEFPDLIPFRTVLEKGAHIWKAGHASDFEARARSVRPDQTATIIYTSGTSGQPKGVMLSHDNLAAMVAATRQHGSIPMKSGERALSFLPLSHVLERAGDYYFWDSGVSIYYAESVQSVSENLKEVRPHAAISVPRLFEKIYSAVTSTPGTKGKLIRWAVQVGRQWSETVISGQTPDGKLRRQYRIADRLVFSKIRKRMGGHLRTFICGGAPLSSEVCAFFYAAGMIIMEGYGLTETSPVLSANRPGAYRFGTVGVPYPGVEMRLSLGGEIQVRGPSVMQGYWEQPEMTAEAIDAEGWLHTGDIGEFDADGFVRITGRIKDLIITAGGKNIAPQPIEQHASESRYVSQAVLIGDRRPYPVLLVVPDWTTLADWAVRHGVDLSDRLRAIQDTRLVRFMENEVLGRLQGFARYELPKKLSLIAEEFSVEMGTLTPSLKARRHVIEKIYRSLIDQLYREAPTGS